MTMGIILFIPICWRFTYILLDSYAYYDPAYLSCTASCFTDKEFYIYFMIDFCLTICAPMIILVAANVSIIYITSKSASRTGSSATPNKKTVITLSCICWAFILSYGPYLIFTVLFVILNLNFYPPEWLILITLYCPSINVVSNPIIYTATNSRFRKFVKSLFTMRKVQVHSGCEEDQSTQSTQVT